MSAFNPTYNPIGYPTDPYGRPLLENPYAPFYPGPFADQQQRVKAYAQQHDKVLCFLHLSPTEFARRTCTLLINLGYLNAAATPEVWADRLLDFHECYLQGNLLENTQGTLGINDNLRNKLRTLVKEIHISPNPRPFEDPLDPARSFHVQHKEPIGT
ncbi:hypothetical protein C0989_002892 [Termitomyces sp. Mn162]|nr:hypothetical protein C0989_002892 [Termitomyces sp. Mn162]